MKNPGLPDTLWEALDQRLWHATGKKALFRIVADAHIKIVGDRYKQSLCRYLECVSLFDFGPSAADDCDQFRHWSGWFGHQQGSRLSIWLEIDRDAVADNIYDAAEMRELFKENLSKTFIPGVEAGHRGPLPIDRLHGALVIDDWHREIFARFTKVDETLISGAVDFERRLLSDREQEYSHIEPEELANIEERLRQARMRVART